MDFNNFFRGFFGFPRRGNTDEYDDSFSDIFEGHFIPQQPPNEDDNEDNEEGMHRFGSGGWPDNQHKHFSFNVFTEPLEMQRYFEQQMDEMMKTFRIFQPPSVFGGDFPALEPPRTDPEKSLDSRSLRDRMLKDDDSFHPRRRPRTILPQPEEKVDTDLDDRIAAGELDEILKENNVKPSSKETPVDPPTSVMPFAPRTWSFSSSVVSKTIKKGDGVVEHHRTVQDSKGNKETTITRTVGDQSHCTTIRTDPGGVEEKEEAFINVDEKNMADFEKNWNDRQKKPSQEDFPRYDILTRRPTPGDTENESIFRKLFGF